MKFRHSWAFCWIVGVCFLGTVDWELNVEGTCTNGVVYGSSLWIIIAAITIEIQISDRNMRKRDVRGSKLSLYGCCVRRGFFGCGNAGWKLDIRMKQRYNKRLFSLFLGSRRK